MFKRIETDEALIVERGVFKPADVYEGPDGGLYAKAKGGFVRLKADGSTSHWAVSCSRLSREGQIYRDPHGRLSILSGPGRKPCLPVALRAPDEE